MWKRLVQQITELFHRIRNQLRNNPLGSLLVITLSFLLAWIVRETYKANNLGFSTKTFWDWMDLLIIPVVLAIGALLFNRTEREANQRIAAERFQEEVLMAYLDKMAELLLESGLRRSSYDEEVRVAARAQTLTTFRILDGKRKGVILSFLADAKLIKKEDPVVDLEYSDLHEAKLDGANLYETNLTSTNLQGADLRNTLLCKSSLITTNLRNSDLRDSNLSGVNFSGADLSGADLRGALLEDAVFLDADLTEANLAGTFQFDDARLSQAMSLKNTVMPSGRMHN